ncbi:MAG: aromatic amino acid lyase, partial [Bacilli bacterium]|nr:aromatic amino acid lyase [Bacilli bacterium]
MKTIVIDGNSLSLEDFIEVVRFKAKVIISDEAKDRITKCRTYLEELINRDNIIYGVNTGFGKLSQIKINLSDMTKLQENLLKSHACGVGNYLDEETTRGIMLLRINALSKGYSGIRLEVIERLVFYLNEDILPLIPEKGSLGASGDLA